VGQTTLEIRRRHPSARIHAFEPIQSTFDLLKEKVGALPGVTCHRLALSDREGEQTIRAVPGSVFNSLDSKLLAEEKNAVQEGILLSTVDRFLAGQNLRSVDLLKTDTEGHDLKVLEGAKDVLSRGGVGCVYTEVTFSRENSHNTQFVPVFDLLRGAGYRFMGLYEMEHFQTNPWNLSFCNALFARTVAPKTAAGS
jgi:FkbM family methyltransferase